MPLDRMLPGTRWTEVLRQARAAHCTTPILFLTALGSLEDRVTGLDLGADDYLVKPFAFEELMAPDPLLSVGAQQRLTDQHMTWHDLSFDPEQSDALLRRPALLVVPPGRCTALPLLTHPEQTLPRETILLRIWGEESDVESGNLDNYIHFLRRRLKTVGSQAQLVTARGVGYRLTDMMMMVMPGSSGQKAVHACMIRLLNLGPAKHSQSASLLVRSYGIFPQAGECLSAFTFT
ncbi:MAG: response regulator transcription factor [Lachnospiraceae bacterium]